MKLVEFIHRDMEPILSEWETFARSLPVGAAMDREALRDHARQILETVCHDIVVAQTQAEQDLKSRGMGPAPGPEETAAQTHALLRARSHFDVNQVVAEYRALRASVLKLWAKACAGLAPDLQEMVRFNEAIDQAICESVAFFSSEVDRARDLLLGVLGHDMRNPLNAIQLTAHYLTKLNAGADVSAAAGRLISSGARMKALLDDLTDFNRVRLGLGIRVEGEAIDLRRVFEEQLQQLRAAHPGRDIQLLASGDLQGVWDEDRLHQLLGNLVLNALRYGYSDTPVRIRLTGAETEVVFSVENDGAPMAEADLARMFEPLRRGEKEGDEGSLGLGLFICREVARAHGGSIVAQPTGSGVVFTIRLPRPRPEAARPGA